MRIMDDKVELVQLQLIISVALAIAEKLILYWHKYRNFVRLNAAFWSEKVRNAIENLGRPAAKMKIADAKTISGRKCDSTCGRSKFGKKPGLFFREHYRRLFCCPDALVETTNGGVLIDR
jgi:hypothetical protein